MMQSKMREKEFREKVAARVAGTGECWSVAEIAIACAREAGLEFAPEPEPEPLPARLKMAGRRVFLVRPILEDKTATEDEIATAIVYSGASNHPCSQFNQRALAAAVDRYNAYPGLRAAAERFLGLVKPYAGGGKIEAAASMLEAELAKGPKP